MDAAYIVIPLLIAWILTGLFVIPVTATLELMVCQLLKGKWTHRLPVAAGILMCVPAAWITRSLYISTEVPVFGGIRVSWIILVCGILTAELGTRIGYRISKKIST